MLFIGSIFVNGQSQIPSNFMGLCGCCDSIMPIEEIENSCTNQSSLYSNNSWWLPTNNDEIKYVRVNFIFLHKQNDGLGNFVSGNQEHEAIIDDLVSQINSVYSTLHNPNDPNCHINEGLISDTRIRIVANIIHHTDPYYWNNENDPISPCSTAWLNPLDEQIVNDPSNEKGINIYFTENETEFNNLVVYHTTQEEPEKIIACSESPSTNNFTRSSKIHVPGMFSKYYWMKNYAPTVFNESWDPTIREWFIHTVGNQIAHELGHSFNLTHISSCNYNLMSMHPANSYFEESLTPDQIGEIHRYLSISSVRKYTTDESYLSTPYFITSDTEWDLNFTSYRDVIVEHEVTLTISCKLVMKSNAKIIVKQNGKLIVDGGIITTEDDKQWPGIEVWGNSSQGQQIVNGLCSQGYLELKNGAVIENAKCAVELWRPNYWNTTGGIIHATDATFRNNAKAVHALHYHNNLYGREGDYNGYFRNCTFTIDEDYIGTETFYKHIDLKRVKGLDFLGCSFSTDRNVSGVYPLCVGIGAYSASFWVNSYCDNHNIVPCPEENVIRPMFHGFYQGIHASDDGGGAYAFSVKNSVFYNNACGIYALNSGYGIIVDNDFTVDCGWDCNFGIYTDEVSGFCIEDNTFHPKTVNTGSPYGIEIVNSQGINDVYNNDFRNLRCGNVALGSNIGNMTSPNDALGLTYSCNTNTGNVIDFCVLKDGNTGDIASSQGSTTLPAGNTFSGSQYHFYNDGVNPIDYYYSNGLGQMPSLLYRVGANGTQSTNSCLSHYSGGGSVSKTASEKAALVSDYLSARSTYNSLLQLYESRIDGGSTPTQVADINSATPSDMWQLRAQLLGLSPYVSGEVLTTAADRYDVFTDPVLFEILAANPDELKKDTLISYLESKEHPLPTYMTDLLRQMASGFTARTALQAQMAQYRHTYSLAAGDIVRSCLNDSVTDLAELRTWLGNMDDMASDRMIVASYLQEGDSTNAFTLANMLPELYNLQGDALADHLDYMRLIGLYQTLNREHRSVFELTDTEIALVNGIASSGIGTSQAMADALLEGISEDHLRSYSCPTMPGNNNGNRGDVGLVDASMNKALGFTVSVSPNPATTWTTITYTLPADATKANIILTNTLGITVATYNLSGNDLQKVLDLRSLASGVYTYTVSCGKHSQTGKLVIVK